LSRAASASTISQLAQSSEDWQLAANRWQDAINLMKSVPAASSNQAVAQQKIREYQDNLAQAQKQLQQLESSSSTPVSVIVPKSETQPNQNGPAASSTAPVDQSSPNEGSQANVYQVPIRRRSGGTPVIEVLFNGNLRVEMIVDTGASGTVITAKAAAAMDIEPVGKANVNTASAKNVVFDIGYVDSIEVNGALLMDVPVAIGPDLDIGLLGNDFFGHYDVTIREKEVEFRPRQSSPIQG